MTNLKDVLETHVGKGSAPGAVGLVARGDRVEVEDGGAHLGADAVALVGEAEPGAGLGLAGDGEAGGEEVLPADDLAAEENGKTQMPLLWLPLGHRAQDVLEGGPADVLRGPSVQGREKGISAGSWTPSAATAARSSSRSRPGRRSSRRGVVRRRPYNGQKRGSMTGCCRGEQPAVEPITGPGPSGR
jgi:hypothetical protein